MALVLRNAPDSEMALEDLFRARAVKTISQPNGGSLGR
jgi:hypothetical protein